MLEELIDRLKPRLQTTPLLRGLSKQELAHRYHAFQLLRLGGERLAAGLVPGRRRPRVAATACWGFPIYSQTFVYQELAQLIRRGFDLRFLYSSLNPRDHLPPQFGALWPAKRKMVHDPAVYARDYAYFRRKAPDKIESLVERLCRASGLSAGELRGQYHFQQAFTFTRMVEAYRPDYLHSYFFYEGTLFTYVASHLLDIPRGVSCYSDHLLDDYILKVVPLHLEQCGVVIATSHRIKRELMSIAPYVDPGKIVVKPNAINADRFPVAARNDPPAGQPYRLVSVSRIEPKKGVIYLVEAMRMLLDRKIDVRVHLLGGVDENAAGRTYAQAVEARIRELGLEDAIRLEGRQTEPEIRRFLGDSQLFVAPFIETDSGDKDGIPTALLEAMATGIPAVATDAGSIPEVIEEGVDGILVPQRDPAALARAIEDLLRDPERRRRLGQQAAARIRERYDVEVCERVFHDRIRTVVARGKIAPESPDERLARFWKEHLAALPLACGEDGPAGSTEGEKPGRIDMKACCRRHVLEKMTADAGGLAPGGILLTDGTNPDLTFADWAALGGLFGLKATRLDGDIYALALPETHIPDGRGQRPAEWSLRAAGGNEATVVCPPDQPDAVRVLIGKAASKVSYDIQLNLTGLKLEADCAYTCALRARADRPRTAFVGVAQAHDPWRGLGLYEEIELSPDWREFHKEFVATAGDDEARLHVDLGTSDIPVEVSLARISRVAG